VLKIDADIRRLVAFLADKPRGPSAGLEEIPYLLVIDFQMPLMAGMELAQALRNASAPQIPIIQEGVAQAPIGRDNPDIFDALVDKPHNEKKLIET
jgi:CheY-like chemotaxis protein